jgi:hypothetical protein
VGTPGKKPLVIEWQIDARTDNEVHVNQLWGFKSEEGLDHYAHALNQHKLLVVG